MSCPIPFPSVWDNTMRGAYVSCPRKFYWEFMRRLGPLDPSIHLHFGGCFAKGLEDFRRIYYDTAHITDCTHRFDAALAEGVRAILTEWGDFEAPEGETKNLDSCLLAFDAYLQHWAPATDYIKPYITRSGSPAVEFTFAIPLEDVLHPTTGEPLIYAGRFDMLAVYNEQLFVEDDKTTKQLGPTWPRQWPLRAQFIGYCWAAQEYGLPVAGTIVRGTAIYKDRFGFAESIIPSHKWKIARWREQLSLDLERAKADWRANRWGYDFDSACASYGGCSFQRLCDAPDAERWIEGNYAERHWNPLAADPTAPEEVK